MEKKDVDYLRIALMMAGIKTDNCACEIILRVQKAMRKKKLKFDLETACKIEVQVRHKYNIKKAIKDATIH